ncbi:DnaD and phage-associated domain protein, partial [gut metagenome]
MFKMGQFEVYNSFPGGFTIISNHFLDCYMPSANGEFVKIYLYMLRHACQEKTYLEISSIADVFNCTEADIHRALRYWKKVGALDADFDANGNLSRVTFCFSQPSGKESAKDPQEKPEAVKSTLTPDKIQALKGNEEVRQLLFIAEQYLGKPLTPTDMETLLYLYDEVGLSGELMEYLIEYCVSKGSTSMAYIK